jgi:tetratricopeptide (TPR) repeat protein
MKKYFRHFYSFSKEKRKLLGMLALVFLIPYFFLFSSWSQVAGNLFFGGIPSLYNVTLAQFFFKQSAYPMLREVRPYAHYQLSRTYFIQGDLEAALHEAQEELKYFPKNNRTYYILGLTYGYLNQEQEAINAFGKFIETNPGTWAARNDKAWLEFRIGDMDAALVTMEPIAWLTDNAWVQNTYGTILMNKKRYGEAETAFLNAKKAAKNLTEKEWGAAYPGNDPRVYGTGLESMKLSIDSNLETLETKLK